MTHASRCDKTTRAPKPSPISLSPFHIRSQVRHPWYRVEHNFQHVSEARNEDEEWDKQVVNTQLERTMLEFAVLLRHTEEFRHEVQHLDMRDKACGAALKVRSFSILHAVLDWLMYLTC